jgi:uncharacterized protein YbaA (DUF1428 family)
MTYIEGFVTAVPTANKQAYKDHAEKALRIFRKFGETRCVECWGDNLPKGETTDFYRAVKAKGDETVVFSWIEWPDKEAREVGMEKVMQEMQTGMQNDPMPFDGQRMIFGGFETLVEDP